MEVSSSAGSSARKLQSMKASSLFTSSIPTKDSSLGSDLSLAPQPPPTYATVSGTATSPPLGSDLSLALQPPPTYATISGTATSPPLGSTTSPPLGSGLSPLQAPTSSLISLPQMKDSKVKALNFPVTMITIGEWTKASVQREDILAKCYFGKKQLMWEFPDSEQSETGSMKKRWKKIEMEWKWILSHKACLQIGLLDFELSKAPRFYIEADPMSVGNKWQEIPELTPNHPSSICRRHRLHVAPDVLQKSYKTLVLGWPEVAHQVPYPSLDSHSF